MPKASRISTVDGRGRTSIPAEVRQELQLKPGQRLLWGALRDCELQVIVLPESKPLGARVMLGFARRFREVRSTAEWMKELR